MYLHNLFLICSISARRASFLLTGITSNWPGIIQKLFFFFEQQLSAINQQFFILFIYFYLFIFRFLLMGI